jgi:hypothetical protein
VPILHNKMIRHYLHHLLTMLLGFFFFFFLFFEIAPTLILDGNRFRGMRLLRQLMHHFSIKRNARLNIGIKAAYLDFDKREGRKDYFLLHLHFFGICSELYE